MSRKVFIFGATGFVGSGLATLLAGEDWEVVGVSRKGSGDVDGVKQWVTPDEADFSGCDAVVNLAGDPIDQRWTKERKKSFYESRVGVTKEIVRKISELPAELRPGVLLNASAVGYYGGRGDETLEEGASRGEGFLADLCAAWEEAAQEAEDFGVRVVRVRIGVVLGEGGQAFEKLKLVFKAGIGGRLGDGRQWMPWIHVEDLRRAMAFCISHAEMTGAVNGTAPTPERNGNLTKKMAKAVNRWVFLPVPGFALKILLGGFGGALLVGQRAVPAKLLEAGFAFRFEKLENALEDLVG